MSMPFIINKETFFEDIDLTKEEFYQRLEEGSNISTSQPSPESVMNLWDEVLKEYDQLVHIPMSSGLQGSCQTAMMLAQDYDGKVEVVNNQRLFSYSAGIRAGCSEAGRARYGCCTDPGNTGT